MVEVFNKIEKFIKSCISSLENPMEMEDVTNYGDKKLEVVVTASKYMISISILLDYTYDLMVVEIESEVVVISNTKNCNNIDELFQELRENFEDIGKLTI